MPKISDAFKTEKVSLPSYPDSEVVYKTNINMGAMVDAEKLSGDVEKSVCLATKMIVDWNFQNEQGEKLPISEEVLKQFPIKDLEFLFSQITPHLQKKTVSEKTA